MFGGASTDTAESYLFIIAVWRRKINYSPLTIRKIFGNSGAF